MSNSTPQWALVVGIIMMLFGGCDGVQSIQQANTRSGLAMQEKMLENFTSPDGLPEAFEDLVPDSLKKDSAARKRLEGFGKMAESMGEMMKMSEFTIKWNVRFGYLGIIIAIFYFVGGLFLLVKKPYSIRLATVILIVDTLFIVAQSIVLSMDGESGLMIQQAATVPLFGIILNVILLVVIRTSDRSAFQMDTVEKANY